jgi:murein DD-endopeptidase MepM/ murein hydrolase activator NlpD
MLLLISRFLALGLAGAIGATAGSPVAAQAINELSRASALPSGSSGEFQRRMLGWNEPESAAPLRLMDRPYPSNSMHLDRLTISSRFGWRSDPITGIERHHEGIDLPGHFGSRVMATGAGIVRIAGWVRGYGNLVEIEHPGGVRTRYGHLARLHVFPSEQVAPGQMIGDIGSTGRSTGPHLHYEVRVNGHAVDPLRFAGLGTPSYETTWGADLQINPKWIGWTEQNSNTSLPEAHIL